MADLEAVLADVSYLMAMEKSKSTPTARASRRLALPDPSVRSIMHKHLTNEGGVAFDKIFNQEIGYILFSQFCHDLCQGKSTLIDFYEEIKQFEKLESEEGRIERSRQIYDRFIMQELLCRTHIYTQDALDHVQHKLSNLQKNHKLPFDVFQPYKEEIATILRERYFSRFLQSDKYTRFCQWKNLELNISLSMNDFSVHRIIGRGGFGEVYGCRKADTGKMYAMKCLDKKRIKMKVGETLALNELAMLTLVSTGIGCPFIVCMTYSFQTPEKLCFLLDLMNGGDLHYHLNQHGVFSEKDARFYASEVLLGLEHMHKRFVVYRDLKPANILLDESGHVRISDLGLACDFSKKRPHACVGTHGYMAPEVLQRGISYDSSADWFSFGCMIYKLLHGRSPFRQHRTKDKGEIDKMTLGINVEFPKDMSVEMQDLLTRLLERDVEVRLGCGGLGAEEIKKHSFFAKIEWQQVYSRMYTPPVIPPRGEVNAADAFDIGSFDEEDVKGIKLTDEDSDLYRDFEKVISERWQQEILETVFESVEQEMDKQEAKKKSKRQHDQGTDCIVEGEVMKLGGPFLQSWQKKYAKLYPNRLEFYARSRDGMLVEGKGVELIPMEEIRSISEEFQRVNKMENCILIQLKNDTKIVCTSTDRLIIQQWKKEMVLALKRTLELLACTNKKAIKVYGADLQREASGAVSALQSTSSQDEGCFPAL